MDDKKISVIVPVFNTACYLEKCVDSLRNQTYGNLEIILVDDGSEDESGKLCDRYAECDVRIKVIHKENGGLISAWKRGVEESCGEYLSFVDSDDWVDENMMEEMSAQLTGVPGEMIISDYVIEQEKGGQKYVWQGLPPGEYGRGDIKKKVIPNLLGREDRYVTISRCMKLIARKLIEDNQHYSDPAVVMGEDATVILPALIDCERLIVMDHKAYYHYRYVRESMVHQYDEKLYANIQLLKRTLQGMIEDKFTGEERNERLGQLEQEYVYLMLLVLKNEAGGNRDDCWRNIFAICKSAENRKLAKDVPVTVQKPANRLLYLVFRHPNIVTVSILKAAMLWYGRSI